MVPFSSIISEAMLEKSVGYALGWLLAASVALVSCASSPGGDHSAVGGPINAGKDVRYSELRGDLHIVELYAGDAPRLRVDRESAAYEAMLWFRFMGVADRLDAAQLLEGAQALFGHVPEAFEAGLALRDVVVPAYFYDGSPLVVSVRVYRDSRGRPVVAASHNADPALLAGAGTSSSARKAGPKFAYPPALEGDVESSRGDSWLFTIGPDGFVSSLADLDAPPPEFTAGIDPASCVVLADRAFRDGKAEGDAEAIRALRDLERDERITGYLAAMVRIRLVQGYLYSGDLALAESALAGFTASKAFQDPAFARSEAYALVIKDLPIALYLAREL
jgi:hypothetical protein